MKTPKYVFNNKGHNLKIVRGPLENFKSNVGAHDLIV